jgi:hypothetical protein
MIVRSYPSGKGDGELLHPGVCYLFVFDKEGGVSGALFQERARVIKWGEPIICFRLFQI